MKNILSFVLGLVCYSAVAQPVLSNIDNYTVGDSAVMTAGAFMPPGGGGAARVWDFSNMQSLSDTSIITIVAPASTPYASSHPAANIVEKHGTGQYYYIDKHTDSSFLVGFVEQSSAHVSYHNPKLFITWPFTYLDVIADSFEYRNNTTGPSSEGKGSHTVEADGYGTLILPTDTFNNTLRLKLRSREKDSSISYVFDVTAVTYLWYDSMHVLPLMRIDSIHYDFGSGTFDTTFVSYIATRRPTAISNVSGDEKNISGHLSGQQLTIKGLDVKGDYSISLYDMQGRKMDVLPLSTSGDVSIYHVVSSLIPGVYLVQITDYDKGGGRLLRLLKQ